MPPRIKHLLFRYHFPISLLLILLAIVLYSSVDSLHSVEFLLGGIGGAVAVSYFSFQYGMEERKFLRELFSDFNTRYNGLNERLFDISKATGELSTDEKKTLADYFNLCAEEWFYFREGIVPVPIWKSWLNGMLQYYRVERIRKFWDEELSSNSYYEFRFEAF